MTKPVQKAEYGKKSNRKVILLCLVLVLMLVVGGIASMQAYFTDMETSENRFTVGDVVVTASVTGGELTVKNDGSVNCYIRVFAEMERPDSGLTIETTNTTNWSEKNDNGYYYYDGTVAPGAFTEPLFTGLSANAEQEMIIYAEGVQAEGFGSAEQAFTLTQSGE